MYWSFIAFQSIVYLYFIAQFVFGYCEKFLFYANYAMNQSFIDY